MKKIAVSLFLFMSIIAAGCASTATKSDLSSYSGRTFYLRKVTFNDFQTGGGFKTPELKKEEVSRLFENLPLETIKAFYKKQYGITLDSTDFESELSDTSKISSIVGKSTWTHRNAATLDNAVEIHLGLKMLSSTHLSFSGVETRVVPLKTYTFYLFADGKRKSVDSSSYNVIEPPENKKNLREATPIISKAGMEKEEFRYQVREKVITSMFAEELASWLQEQAGGSLVVRQSQTPPSAGLNDADAGEGEAAADEEAVEEETGAIEPEEDLVE